LQTNDPLVRQVLPDETGKKVTVVGTSIQWWDVERNRRERRWQAHQDQRTAVTLGADDSIRAWNQATRTIRSFGTSYPSGWRTAVHATGDPSPPRLYPLTEHYGPTWYVFSPDNRYLASPDILRDLTTGAVVWTSTSPRSQQTTFGPGGWVVGMALDRTYALLEVASGNVYQLDNQFRDGPPVGAFSPDGHLLAIGDHTGVVHLRELVTGRELARLRGHEQAVTALCFSPDGKTLVSGGEDTTILLYDVEPYRKALTPLPWQREQAEKLWQQLGDRDPAKGQLAVAAFSGGGDEAVRELRERLAPVPKRSADELARLVADLDSERFATRRQAFAQLARLGTIAEPQLRKAAAAPRSLEQSRYLKQLVDQLKEVSDETIRDVRCVQLLDRIGTEEARRFLRELADGMPQARLTREAKACLGRLRLGKKNR
jgi:hypothetical protein